MYFLARANCRLVRKMRKLFRERCYVKSKTNNIWWLIRVNAGPEDRDQIARSIKIAYHDERLRSQLIPGENKPGRNYQPRGMKYWELLHQIVQEEPVEDRDRFFMYFLRELGIEKGKVFPVCGNTYRMLHETRFAGHFEFIGSWDTHYGIFADCGTAIPFSGSAASSDEEAAADDCGCC